MVLLIIIPMKNGYFIGNIYPIFRQTQMATLEMIHYGTTWYYMVPTIVWLTKGYTPIQQKRLHRIGLQKCTVHLNARIDMYTCACKVIFKCTCSHTFVFGQTHIIYTLWLFNIAMENSPFIDGLPIKNGDFPWLC